MIKSDILDNPITEEKVIIPEFKNINYGDIIVAKRIDKINPDKILEEGHKNGPFLVLENQGNKLICAYGSSNREKFSNANYSLIVDANNYKYMNKSGAFYIIDIYEITAESFIQKWYSLNDYDKQLLERKIKVVSERNNLLKNM